MKRVYLLTLSLLSSAACFSTIPLPAPAGEPLEVGPGLFPHEVFDAVLAKYVDAEGRVDYRGLKADRTELERYLVAIAKTSPHSHPEYFPSDEEQLAYWINAYNAFVLYAVTERPAMRSVNEDLKAFFYFTQYQLGDEVYTLYKLENDVVRARYNDPRIHFALNCASGGCPALPREAFTPQRLEEQLARESRVFCADQRKVRVQAGTVEMSQLFDWYADDFRGDGGPVAFCRKFGRTDLPDSAPVTFLPYDWSLNAQPGRALFEQGPAP